MKPTAYKIGEGERKCLSKDMQEIILAYQEENKMLEEENRNLKDKIEFLTKCLDDRDKSIELLKEELEQYKKQYEHTMGEDYMNIQCEKISSILKE